MVELNDPAFLLAELQMTLQSMITHLQREHDYQTPDKLPVFIITTGNFLQRQDFPGYRCNDQMGSLNL